MIAFVKGFVSAYGTDYIVVDNNGIGYEIAYAHTENVRLNEEISVYTYMHVTENDVALFGFESMDEKDLFMRLISVKGLGPKTVMNMLATKGYDHIIQAIEAGDVKTLKNLPGIGEKSASQIVLDLKGKLIPTTVKSTSSKQTYPQEIQDALEGLKNLGYKAGELSSVANIMNESPGLTTEEYLRIGLSILSK